MEGLIGVKEAMGLPPGQARARQTYLQKFAQTHKFANQQVA
ncbi:hypothetical protein [Paracidovorax wautersii]|nr:hypothetical protein [Paracidovorax wautersii]